MFNIIIHYPVVYFISKENKLVLYCNFNNLFNNLFRVNSARGIVRVNHYYSPCFRGDFALYIFDVRIPEALLITNVVYSFTSREVSCTCPERVVGHRDKDLIPVIQEPLHTHYDELTYSIADNYIINSDTSDPLELTVLHNGFAGCKKAL